MIIVRVINSPFDQMRGEGDGQPDLWEHGKLVRDCRVGAELRVRQALLRVARAGMQDVHPISWRHHAISGEINLSVFLTFCECVNDYRRISMIVLENRLQATSWIMTTFRGT